MLVKSSDFISSIFIVNVNIEPIPKSETKPILPSNYSQMFLHMHRPKPIPFLFKFLSFSIVPKSLKSLD